MPAPRRPTSPAAEALLVVAPLVTRWMERLLAESDPPLTSSQYLALTAIAGGELTATELARRTGVSGPAVSQLLSGLAGAGLLERRPDPADRRHQTLTLSNAGRRAQRAARALLRTRLDRLLAGLPKPEADALGRLLVSVEAELSGTPPPRRAGPPRRPPPPTRGPR